MQWVILMLLDMHAMHLRSKFSQGLKDATLTPKVRLAVGVFGRRDSRCA
jgi:hypothetical protein